MLGLKDWRHGIRADTIREGIEGEKRIITRRPVSQSTIFTPHTLGVRSFVIHVSAFLPQTFVQQEEEAQINRRFLDDIEAILPLSNQEALGWTNRQKKIAFPSPEKENQDQNIIHKRTTNPKCDHLERRQTNPACAMMF